MRKILILAAAALLLGGCVAPNSVMLADDSALISAHGSSPADREKIIQDVLAIAAKTTAAHGYRYFIILKAEDASRAGTMFLPDRPGTRTAPSNLSRPGANYSQLSRNVSYLRPGLNITIRMFREGEIDPTIKGVWNTDGTMGPSLEKAPNPKEPPRRSSVLRG
ncbi:MAG TPA: hypothetical protein VNH44_14325 [Micropepsaceae bacterium]|nr:hypothetical protein [Micropepsaceae bacterium]